ncbi:hypothetical protein, partial [Catellatospora citrea]
MDVFDSSDRPDVSDGLVGLGRGELTVVRVDVVGDPRHVVLVWRDGDGVLWEVETQTRGSEPMLRPVADGGAALVGAQPLRVVVDDGERMRKVRLGGAGPAVVMAGGVVDTGMSDAGAADGGVAGGGPVEVRPVRVGPLGGWALGVDALVPPSTSTRVGMAPERKKAAK